MSSSKKRMTAWQEHFKISVKMYKLLNDTSCIITNRGQPSKGVFLRFGFFTERGYNEWEKTAKGEVFCHYYLEPPESQFPQSIDPVKVECDVFGS